MPKHQDASLEFTATVTVVYMDIHEDNIAEPFDDPTKNVKSTYKTEKKEVPGVDVLIYGYIARVSL